MPNAASVDGGRCEAGFALETVEFVDANGRAPVAVPARGHTHSREVETIARADARRVNTRMPAKRVDGRTSLHHPAVVEHAAKRSADAQLRIADKITAFAGSMRFVYIHAAVFAVWMTVLERDPWPRLTLAVSLEAIFLSTFVMIGQNRQADFQRAKADHDFATEQQELDENTELTRAIHTLTREIHRHVVGDEDR